MKLLRYGAPGKEQPGMLDQEGRVRSLRGILPDIDANAVSLESLARLALLDPATLPEVLPKRIGPCIAGPSKIVGVAQNYHCFLQAAKMPLPESPVLFMKPPSSVSGPDDDILLPADADRADWEAELGIVMGRTARNITPETALDYIAGYCVINDITERGRIARSGQFLNGKSADTFTPIGPYLVTSDEITDPQNLNIQFDLNGQSYQDGTTASMIFPIVFLLSHISKLMTLLPGDIVATGTPRGVGGRSTPERFLRAGDRVRVAVEGLGEQNARVMDAFAN